MQQKLTGLIITHRDDSRFYEAANCLNFVDELVIVDLTTKGISPQKIAQPIQHYRQQPTQIEDFAAIKNQALKMYCSHPWVLWLDSDEALTEENQTKVVQLLSKIQQGKTSAAGYRCKRTDIFHRKKLEWGEVRNVKIVRLFNKTKTKFEGVVHEKAIVNGPIETTDIEIDHYPHPSISAFITKIADYSALAGSEAFQHQQAFSIFKLITYPVGKWLLNTVFKLAFLDGWRGIAYSLIMSIHSLGVRIKLYELETAHKTKHD